MPGAHVGFVEEDERGVLTDARAKAARLLVPPEISSGSVEVERSTDLGEPLHHDLADLVLDPVGALAQRNAVLS